MKKKYKFIGTLLLAAILATTTISTIVSPVDTTVSAGSLCNALGSGLNASGRVKPEKMLHEDKANRRYSMQELFSGSIGFSSFNGLSEGDWLLSDNSSWGESYAGMDDPVVIEKIEAAGDRTLARCWFGGIDDITASFMLSGASMISRLSQFSTGMLLDNKLLCSSAEDTDCGFNLVSILAGTGKGNDLGIIGMFMNSVFMPLVVIIASMSALYAMVTYAKGKSREAINMVLWSVGAFIFGVAMMTQPTLLVTAPQNISSTVSGCIVLGLNGESCLTEESPDAEPEGTLLVPAECQVTYGGKRDTETLIAGLNCSMWKSFIMEPWAQSQFNKPYSELYTHNAPTGGEIWEAMPKDIRTSIGVSMGSSLSPKSYKDTTLKLDSTAKVYNAAYYQLYLKTANIRTDGDNKTSSEIKRAGYDSRWFNIIPAAASDDSVWSSWADLGGSGTKRVATGFSALAITMITSIIFIGVSLFGIAYSIMGPILIGFGPFFFLMAMIPNKGKGLFLGWLESVLSSIYKYAVSVMIIVLAMSIYSGVINTTSGVATILLTIIITITFWMYRRELVNVLGASSLGGTKLKGKDLKIGDKLKRGAGAVAGAAIGGKLAGGSLGSSAMEGLKREAKRGRSPLAEGFRQFDRTKGERDKARKLIEDVEKVDDNINKDNIDEVAGNGLETPPTEPNIGTELDIVGGSQLGGPNAGVDLNVGVSLKDVVLGYMKDPESNLNGDRLLSLLDNSTDKELADVIVSSEGIDPVSPVAITLQAARATRVLESNDPSNPLNSNSLKADRSSPSGMTTNELFDLAQSKDYMSAKNTSPEAQAVRAEMAARAQMNSLGHSIEAIDAATTRQFNQDSGKPTGGLTGGPGGLDNSPGATGQLPLDLLEDEPSPRSEVTKSELESKPAVSKVEPSGMPKVTEPNSMPSLSAIDNRNKMDESVDKPKTPGLPLDAINDSKE